MPTSDKQYNGQLIDEYQRLMRIRKLAVEENATETIKAIDLELEYIKLKLQPLEIPEM